MDELEQRLKQARLSEPSPELDRRIADAFASARSGRKESRKVGLWWWMAALSAAGCTAALVVVFAPGSPPAPEATVYEIEAQGHMREMLINGTATPAASPQFVFGLSAR